MNLSDTIAAISSAATPAPRAIVRASGPLVRELHQHLTGSDIFLANSARETSLRFSDLICPAHVYCFAAPRSFTGDDLLELHIPGNPILTRLLLEELIRLGVRHAEPGEFTARGFFNNKFDLAAAEGVAATIAANSERELLAARQLLAGELANRLRPITDSLAQTLGLLEVGIDFSEEDVSFISTAQLQDRLNSINTALRDLLNESSRFDRLSHEPQIVLVGTPNAGKSTLLNCLAGENRAIVSPHAGTTRDAIFATISLRRGRARLIDIAGLESASDEISKEMQSHALRTIEQADVIVYVRDCSDVNSTFELPREPHLRIATKSDLRKIISDSEFAVSAHTGEGIESLREKLDALAFGETSASATPLALNARHVAAIESARANVSRAKELNESELIAMELREALDFLGSIIGHIAPDEVLGQIFATFCIGK